jgi:hypothetical protein
VETNFNAATMPSRCADEATAYRQISALAASDLGPQMAVLAL